MGIGKSSTKIVRFVPNHFKINQVVFDKTIFLVLFCCHDNQNYALNTNLWTTLKGGPFAHSFLQVPQTAYRASKDWDEFQVNPLPHRDDLFTLLQTEQA